MFSGRCRLRARLSKQSCAMLSECAYHVDCGGCSVTCSALCLPAVTTCTAYQADMPYMHGMMQPSIHVLTVTAVHTPCCDDSLQTGGCTLLQSFV